MIYGNWQTVTIANTAKLSDFANLGRDGWEQAQMVFDAMTAADINLLVSITSTDTINSTFYNLGSAKPAFNCLTGNFATEVNLGGYQFAKVNCTVAQGAERTIKIRGARS